jgi:hypothetical protein
MLESSWVVAQLVTSQEGLSSMSECKYRMSIIRFVSIAVWAVAADIVLETKRRAVFPSSSPAVRVSKINIMCARRQFCELKWNMYSGDGTHFSESVEVNLIFLTQAVSTLQLSNFSCNHDLYLSETFPAFLPLLQVKVKVTLRLTVSQSVLQSKQGRAVAYYRQPASTVTPGIKPRWDPWPRRLFFSFFCCSSFDKKGGVALFYNWCSLTTPYSTRGPIKVGDLYILYIIHKTQADTKFYYMLGHLLMQDSAAAYASTYLKLRNGS